MENNVTGTIRSRGIKDPLNAESTPIGYLLNGCYSSLKLGAGGPLFSAFGAMWGFLVSWFWSRRNKEFCRGF